MNYDGKGVIYKMGKKGSVMDIFYLMFAFMVLGMMILVAVYLKDQIFPFFTGVFGTTSEATGVINTTEAVFSTMDTLFLFFYFMMSFTAVIMAAIVKMHPVFLIINVMIMIILFVVAPTMSNVMQEFMSVSEFAPYAAGGSGSLTFPIMTNIFRYLPILTMGISIILMIMSFSKRGEVGF